MFRLSFVSDAGIDDKFHHFGDFDTLAELQPALTLAINDNTTAGDGSRTKAIEKAREFMMIAALDIDTGRGYTTIPVDFGCLVLS